MAKCAKCNKVVNKKNPGLQCGKCCKWMHASCACISTEQLAALLCTDAVNWKCRSCCGGGKPKRVSGILPEMEDEETDNESIHREKSIPIVRKQQHEEILCEIRSDIREIIRDELQTSLQFYSEKIDEYEKKIMEYEGKVKIVENKYYDIKNKYKNLDIKYHTLEQRLNSIEQNQMANQLEICGLKEVKNENLIDSTKQLCTKMKLNSDDIKKVYRKKKRYNTDNNKDPAQPSIVVLTLRDGCREHWLQAARAATLTTRDAGREEGGKVYLREALTASTAQLLWKAKTELKETGKFKFVWCKQGVVMARKGDYEIDKKVHYIRSENDLLRLSEKYKE